MTIDRRLGAVVVKVAGQVTPAAAVTLKHVLTDLVDGQGNVLVALEIPESAIDDAEVVAVLTETTASLESHGRQLLIDAVGSGQTKPNSGDLYN